MAARMTPNRWPGLKPGDKRLTTLRVPTTQIHVTGRNDQLGFMVVYWLLFWHQRIEHLIGTQTGVWNYRPNTTAADLLSEHAGAGAADANWAKHPQGVPISKTFTARQIRRIRAMVKFLNGLAGAEVVRWGGEWPSHPGSHAKTDGMHAEFIQGRILFLVRQLARTPRGRDVLKANPHLKIKGVTYA